MADAKITELPLAATVATNDLLCVVTGVDATAETMKVDVNRFVAQSVKPSDLLVQGEGVTLTTNAAPNADSPETVTVSAATDTIGQDIFPVKVLINDEPMVQNLILRPSDFQQTIPDGTKYIVSTNFVYNFSALNSTQASAISGGLGTTALDAVGNWMHYESISKTQLELHQDGTEQVSNTGTWINLGNNPSSTFDTSTVITSQQRFLVENSSGADVDLRLETVTDYPIQGADAIVLLAGSFISYTKVT